ncbi:MAG TPA: trehalose-phosphatase [Terriglobales bacterium]|nr:trehalose-phosphatase [Terriglobales bacterium]
MAISDAAKFRRGIRMPAFFAIEEEQTWAPILAAPSIFLFLDFDGTLTELAPRPENVHLSSRRRQYLQGLAAVPGLSTAIISGRPIEDLKQLIGLDGLFYIGNHGLEWLAPDGAENRCAIDPPVTDALESLRDQFRDFRVRAKGIFLEDKGTALALHYRMASEDTALTAKNDFLRAVVRHQQQGVALEILAGKEVVEAKPAAVNKGDAVAFFHRHFGAPALPIYCGDDYTDEGAFHRLDKKGITILVAEAPRRTAASFYLRNPNEVYEFLRYLVGVRRGRH